MVHLTVCFCHIMYEFQSESTLLSLKRIRDMTRTYSQMHHTDNYSQRNSIISLVSLNGWVFVYELSGRGFESSCSHLKFRFHASFEQGVPWHLGNCRVRIHSETRTWHDKNIQYRYDFLLTQMQVNLNGENWWRKLH